MNDETDRTPTMMDETVAQEWSEPHLPTIFAKWHHLMGPAAREMTEAIISESGAKPGFDVIDIACGAGTPALAVAEAVGPGGSVTATDPSPIFIEAITENARKKSVTNLTVVQTSAANLPFEPGRFDAATCQFGVMFFPDMSAALRRIMQVLRPGARAAFVAWGPVPENKLFGTFGQAAGPYLPPEAAAEMAKEPPPDAPAPMRFAKPGSLSAELRTAGFADVREQSITANFAWPGTAEELVALQCEITRIEEKMPANRRDAFRSDAIAAFQQFQDGEAIRLPATIVLASGRA